MIRRRVAALIFSSSILVLPACNSGPSVTGSFDRDFSVTGHTRLEISTASGDVRVSGSSDGKVHVHGEVRVSGMALADANKKLADIDANPPLEQTPDGLRLGKNGLALHDVSISYAVEAPRDTEVNCSSASGSETVRDLRGPVKLQSASGSITAENIDGEAQLTSASGSVSATNMGDIVRATSFSATINIANAKGDIRASDQSADIQISKPGARVDAQDTSGNVTIDGANSDAKARSVSGNVTVRGGLSLAAFWELKTISGNAEIAVASNSNFQLLAESASGEIRADVPIMIQEQGKHSLRAQVGTGGGRVEVHTTSGNIHLSPL